MACPQTSREVGIWGGKSERERCRIRAQRARERAAEKQAIVTIATARRTSTYCLIASHERCSVAARCDCECHTLGGTRTELTPAEVGEVDTAAGGILGEPLGKRESLVEERRAAGVRLTHVVEDRPLGARGDDRIRDAVDPDKRALPAAAVVARDRLQRIDPVGSRVFAEAEENHSCHRLGHEV